MTKTANAVIVAAALVMGAMWTSAQEKSKSEDAGIEGRQTEATPLKITVTFTEFEGDKKVKSLPYTMIVVADGGPAKAVLKVGSRVPVYVGKEHGMQYIDIGSSIDCQASRANDNRFNIRLVLERSWVDGGVSVSVDPGASSQSAGQFQEPIVRQFKTELALILRDGQTVESAFATDPLSGKVFKMEVTLNLLK